MVHASINKLYIKYSKYGEFTLFVHFYVSYNCLYFVTASYVTYLASKCC
jgi:hypothetical protein